MKFYYELSSRGIKPEIAFIDGDHSYEAALFDIQSLAKRLARRGFILIDNVSQAGPYYAAMDFLASNPGWTRCKARDPKWDDANKTIDRERTSVPETDFEILRAPQNYLVTSRPQTFGESPSGPEIKGLRIEAETSGGTLYAQCVLRGFGSTGAEQVATAAIDITSPGPLDLFFPHPFSVIGTFSHCTVESWLIWRGEKPLSLFSAPKVIS
jgi:hypothetical protein